MSKTNVAAAFARLGMNHYSRDDAGRAKHTADLAIIRQAFKSHPRDAKRYLWLRDHLLITDIIKVKDTKPCTDISYAAELDQLVDDCRGAGKTREPAV